MIIDQHTVIYGVLGFPLHHTLSPTMHNTAFNVTGVNAVYLAFETRNIDGCLKGIKALDIKGMSVTLPHKSSMIPLLDEVDDLAKKIGAVNTIVNKGGRLIGYNTDAIGALKALEEKIELSGKTCILIGAGGAARAIGFILKESGVKLKVANRSYEKGRALAHSLNCPFIHIDQIETFGIDLLIHTTPVGMIPHEYQCIVPEHVLKKGMVVMDIIYNPIETRLLTMAKTKGCLTINGLGMFVHQGAEQFRLWTDMDPPINAMKQAVKGALRR